MTPNFFCCWLHNFLCPQISVRCLQSPWVQQSFTSQLSSRSVGVITYEALYGYRPFNDAGSLEGAELFDGVVKDLVVLGERLWILFVEYPAAGTPVCYHFFWATQEIHPGLSETKRILVCRVPPVNHCYLMFSQLNGHIGGIHHIHLLHHFQTHKIMWLVIYPIISHFIG